MSVVYDGVPAGGTGGGNLFQELRFWISQKVPQRQRWIENIKANGGAVVQVESQADVLIADHALSRFAPPSSISWRFLEDCIQTGELVDLEKYRIGGVQAPAKRTKNRFTQEDDDVLRDWVRTLDSASNSKLGGNEVWKQFELMHPNHTWQSWRDRWHKKLAVLEATPRERTLARPSGKASTQSAAAERPAQVSRPVPPTLPRRRDVPTPVLSSIGRKSDGREAPAAAKPPALRGRNSPEADQPDDSHSRRKFQRFLTDYVEAVGEQIDMEPRVRGRKVDLFDLFQSVANQNAPFEEVDWATVAERLNFNWVEMTDVPQALAAIYKASLLDFGIFVEEFADQEGENESTDGEEPLEEVESPVQAQSGQPPERVGIRNRSANTKLSSSPSRETAPIPLPAAKITKRKSDDGTSITPAKRSRHSPRKDIPSTPDERPHGDRTRSLVEEYYSHSVRAPLSRRARAVAAEPETQDFRFQETQVPTLNAQESTIYDISPSQQLRSEAADVEPIPFSFQHTTVGVGSRLSDGAQDDAQFKKPRAATALVQKRKLPGSYNKNRTHLSSSPEDRTPSATDKARQPRTVTPTATAEENSQPGPENWSIDEWIEHFERFYKLEIVRKGLACTTLEPGLAGQVMQNLADGKGIPDDIGGVWTEQDDEGLAFYDEVKPLGMAKTVKEKHLYSGAKAEFARLVEKHGKERIGPRRKYLAYVKQLGLDE